MGGGFDHILLDNYPGLAIVYHPSDDGKVLSVHGQSKQFLLKWIGRSELTHIHQLTHRIKQEQPADETKIIRHEIEKEGKWDIEYPVQLTNNVLWFREKGLYPVEGDDGQKFALVYIHDVTHFKNRETGLRDELDNTQYQSKIKNEFFARMSHEIRTPMNGVMGIAQVLKKTPLTSEQNQYVNTILESSKALLSIINDVLDLSKIEAGKFELNNERFDLENAAYDVCQLLGSRASDKNIELILDYRKGVPRYVIADSGRIRQILVNLTGNAIKFTDNGYVSVRIECEGVSKGEATILFKITDTGIGIPKAAMQKLFSSYSQADASISSTYGGTGLGLTICKQLIELMSGQVGVDSDVGFGSTFWFRIKVGIEPEVNTVSPHDLFRKSGVLVGNNRIHNEVLAQYLIDAGAYITVRDDAEEALASLSEDKNYDFVIIDKNLKNIDGLQLSTLIKRSKQHRDTPVLLLTCTVERINSQMLKQSGVNACSPKPISRSLLYRAIDVITKADPTSDGAAFIANENVAATMNTEPSGKINGHVLVAEDVEVNQLVLKAMLAELGIVADFAATGVEALAKWKNNEYDLILMDCQMPEMDGYETTRRIRRSSREKAKIPIVALTANAMASYKKKCLESGMDDFLAKPFVESALIGKLRKWIDVEQDSDDLVTLTKSGPELNESALVDIEQFAKVKSLMKDEFDDYISSFLVKLDERYVTIANELRNGDLKRVHEEAHALKGLAGMVGAKRIYDLAFDVEQASEAEQFSKAVVSCGELENAIVDTKQVIEKEQNAELEQHVVIF